MARKRYSTEQVGTKICQAEVELGRGLRTPQVCKKLRISSRRTTAGGRSTAAWVWTRTSG